MAQYTDFEKELLSHFKEQFRINVSYNKDEEIYDKVVEHVFGPGARDPHLHIKWGKVFNENMCPACHERITLLEDVFFCSTCGFTISADLIDEAGIEYKKKAEAFEKDKIIKEKISKSKMTSHQLDSLYEIAKKEIIAVLEKEGKAK